MSAFEVFVCVSGVLVWSGIWALGHFLTRDKVVSQPGGDYLVSLRAKD